MTQAHVVLDNPNVTPRQTTDTWATVINANADDAEARLTSANTAAAAAQTAASTASTNASKAVAAVGGKYDVDTVVVSASRPLLAATDAGKTLAVVSTTAVVLSSLPAGFSFLCIEQLGLGSVSVTAASGVTITGTASTSVTSPILVLRESTTTPGTYTAFQASRTVMAMLDDGTPSGVTLNALALVGLTPLGQAYRGPKASGTDQTAILQEFFDDMSSDARAARQQRIVELEPDAEYLGQGWLHPEYLRINGRGAMLTKIANVSGDWKTSPTNCVIRLKIQQKAGQTSWYGSGRNVGLENIILNANNKNYLAVAEYLNFENLVWDNVTMIASQWSSNWTTRLGGRHFFNKNPKILGAARVYQDGLHSLYGRNHVTVGGYVESGDDSYACGDDQLTSSVYMDDEGLENVCVVGLTVRSTSGFSPKVYAPAAKPFAAAPNNYVNTGKVKGIYISLSGKSGLIRNGGLSCFNVASGNNRVLSDISDVEIHANLEVGTDGTGVYSAIAGVSLGTPSGVTSGNPATVSLPGHGLTAGDVVSFVGIPSTGMHRLVSFYQAISTTGSVGSGGYYSPSTTTMDPNSFALSDNAYRGTIGLDSTSFEAWTTGTLIKNSVGSGYKVNDDLTLAGGTFTEAAIFRATQVGPNGELQAVRCITPGKYSVLPPTPNSPTGGSGTGAVLHLELTHSGVNAHGSHQVGAQDIKIRGRLKINDTSGSAARFDTGWHEDCEHVDFKMTANVPANGGVYLVYGGTDKQRSKRNRVAGHLTCDTGIPNSVAPVMLFNSADSLLEDLLIDNVQTNSAGVLFGFAGNILNPRTVAAVTSADPAVLTVTAFPWKTDDYVMWQGSVLNTTVNAGSFVVGNTYVIATAGTTDFTAVGASSNAVGTVFVATGSGSGTGTASDSMDGVYRILQALDDSTLKLKTIEGDAVWLNGRTLTTRGTLTLANNTAVARRVKVVEASGAVSTMGFQAASKTPFRVTALRIEDCDLSGVDNPITDNIAATPIFSVTNTKGINQQVNTFRTYVVVPNGLVCETQRIIIPPNTPTNAGSFVVGNAYSITTVGTTDFTAVGAANNNVGTVFVATGAGSGTGVAGTTVTVAAPKWQRPGQRIRMFFEHPSVATALSEASFNSCYKMNALPASTGQGNKTGAISFTCVAVGKWVQDAGPLLYV